MRGGPAPCSGQASTPVPLLVQGGDCPNSRTVIPRCGVPPFAQGASAVSDSVVAQPQHPRLRKGRRRALGALPRRWNTSACAGRTCVCPTRLARAAEPPLAWREELAVPRAPPHVRKAPARAGRKLVVVVDRQALQSTPACAERRAGAPRPPRGGAAPPACARRTIREAAKGKRATVHPSPLARGGRGSRSAGACTGRCTPARAGRRLPHQPGGAWCPVYPVCAGRRLRDLRLCGLVAALRC